MGRVFGEGRLVFRAMEESKSEDEGKDGEGRNGRFLILTQIISKLGDLLCNPKTVLTWLMGVVGAPPGLTSLLVPIRESGSMLPQLFISSFVKRVPRRKWVFAVGGVGQAISVMAMGASALLFEGAVAGWAIVLSLVVFSLARCLSSIASKEVLGKAISKGKRGRISGVAGSVSGLIGMGGALFVLLGFNQEVGKAAYGWFLVGGAGFYLIAAFVMTLVEEEQSKVEGDDLAGDLRKRLGLVWTDRVLRKFVVVRTLLLGSALASPYLVVLSQQQGFDLRSLAGFVLAGGLASALSSILWGRLSDRSSRMSMMMGAVIAAGVGLAGVFIAGREGALGDKIWIWPLLFFLISVGYAGVRIGRKTYVVDISGDEKRIDYVSASNTLIALMLLALGAVGSAIQSVGTVWALGFFSVLSLLGGGLTFWLKGVERSD